MSFEHLYGNIRDAFETERFEITSHITLTRILTRINILNRVAGYYEVVSWIELFGDLGNEFILTIKDGDLETKLHVSLIPTTYYFEELAA